jgi:hypothetical protein
MILVFDKCFILCTEEFAFLSNQESKLQSCVMCSQQNIHRNKINVHSIFMFVIMVTQLSLNLIDFSKKFMLK